MKKGGFKLKGKAVDCSGLPALDDAGKEIFRALAVACGHEHNNFPFHSLNNDSFIIVWLDTLFIADKYKLYGSGLSTIQPSDVLGQAAIDAAKGGATIVFEGDELPNLNKYVYYSNGHISSPFIVGGVATSAIVAYKLLEKTPSIESRIISEKMGFKEPAPIGSGEEWKGRELEVYDDLRDAHLDLIRENMEKDKEIELLNQRIKELECARNDAKAALDV